MDYLSRLEGKAASAPPIQNDEDMPDYIDNFYDDLEEHASALRRLSSIKPSDARWLAQLVKQNLDSEHERIPAEIEKELLVSTLNVFEGAKFTREHIQETCPPRNARSHQVLVVKDARTDRRPANRVAHLSVWEVDKIDLSEGSRSASFTVGQRFLVSNLSPNNPSAWMKNEPGAQIFVSTRKDTRWLKRN
ncbi:hypothetical protein H1R20_g4284, partial [Candolleomyces eurysporus]